MSGSRFYCANSLSLSDPRPRRYVQHRLQECGGRMTPAGCSSALQSQMGLIVAPGVAYRPTRGQGTSAETADVPLDPAWKFRRFHIA